MRESKNRQSYLMRFGYMNQTADGAFALRTEDSIRDGIRDMQQFAGIPVTGRLDQQTLHLLRRPRCGLPDRTTAVQTSGRRKRFALQGQKWPYTNLTWSLRSNNLRDLDPYDVRYVLSKALDVWARHSKLTFTEVNSDKADIRIYFYSHDHGDNFPFDGKGVILAHAFFPNGGHTIDVHFDADETWTTTTGTDEGTNLFNVAAHEFGHSLGLSHSSIESALMYPWYKEMEKGFDYELPDDDKWGIQSLYGYRTNRQWGAYHPYYPRQPTTTMTTTTTTTKSTTTTTTTTRRPMTPRVRYTRPTARYPYDPRYNGRHRHYPSTHHPKAPMHPDKKPYYPIKPEHPVHKNPDHRTNHYNPTHTHGSDRPHHHNNHHNHNNPVKESPETEQRPPDTCDTSYDAVALIRREVFIFKDIYFWRIGDKGLTPGYPRKITELWRDLPRNLTHIDAVYERYDGRIVFFIGKLFYVFSTTKLDRESPRPLTDLGLPVELEQIDDVMIWGHNSNTYFYSGSLYWKFDETKRNTVEPDYPRNMKMWKGVGTDIDAVFQWKDGRTYFFKDKGFWKFNDQLMKVEQEEQKPSAPFWMGCTNNLEGAGTGQKLPLKNESNTATRPNYVCILLLTFSFLSLLISC